MSQDPATVTVSAAELQNTLVAADAGLKKYAAEIEQLKSQLAEMNQKQAADAAAVKQASDAAVESLVANKVIQEGERQKAAEILSTLPGALAVLAKTAAHTNHPPKSIGRPERAEKTAGALPRGRFTDQPEVASEVDNNYLAALGIG